METPTERPHGDPLLDEEESDNADTPPALPSEDNEAPLGDTDQHSESDA